MALFSININIEVPIYKKLTAGTLPANKEFAAGTVPENKEYAAGSVPANKEHARGYTQKVAILLLKGMISIMGGAVSKANKPSLWGVAK